MRIYLYFLRYISNLTNSTQNLSKMQSLGQLLKRDTQSRPSSIEHILTSSIRRAKQKILHHQQFEKDENCSYTANTIEDSSKKGMKKFENISDSRYNYQVLSGRRQDRGALAIAMKSLQERIIVLEKQKNDLQRKLTLSSTPSNQKGGQLLKFVIILREKEQQITKITKMNENYQRENAQLRRTVEQFEIKLASSTQQNIKSKEKIDTLNSNNTQLNFLVQKIKSQLQIQKKNNIIQIRLHQEELLKQCSLENSRQTRVKSNSNKNNAERTQNNLGLITALRKENLQLKNKNTELFNIIQRNNASIARHLRENKEHQQKYVNLKQLLNQLVEHSRQMQNPSFSLKNLLNKINRVEHEYMKCLRSQSNGSNKMRMSERSSASIERNKSKLLKMEDLNSSSKKSAYLRSASKSRSKPKTLEESHSERKIKYGLRAVIPSQVKSGIQQIQKQVNRLKKLHRNLMVKTANIQITEEQKDEIDKVITEYNQKKQKLEALKNTTH